MEIRDLHNTPVIGLTPVMVMDSYVKDMNTNLTYSGNYFTGIMHSEEYARFVSVIGMLTGFKSLHIQMWSDAITFATKAQGTIIGEYLVFDWELVIICLLNANLLGNSSSGNRNMPEIPGMFNVDASPSKNAGGSNTKLANTSPLEYGQASKLILTLQS